MTRSPNWMSLAFDSWALAIDSSAVIGLRLAHLACLEGNSVSEAGLMIGEKVQAAVELQMMAATGGLGSSPHAAAARTLTHVRTAVKANRRRLSRKTR